MQEPIRAGQLKDNEDITVSAVPLNPERLNSDTQELAFYDEDDEFCVINLVSPEVKKAMKALDPRLLAMGYDGIVKKRKEWAERDELVRQCFWEEYFGAVDNKKKMNMTACYVRICSRSMFYDMINDPVRLAFMLCPPSEYMWKMKNLLDMAMHRLREVLKLPIVDATGRPNTRLIGEIVKITQMVDTRVKGSVVQKHEIKSENKTMLATTHVSKDAREVGSIQEQLEAVNKELLSLGAIGVPVDKKGENVIDVRATEAVEA